MNTFMGSKWEQEAWNLCMAMLYELDNAFPYLPLPNYLWVHTTGSVLRVMRREREVYMQGIEEASVEDVDMEDVSEGVVPEGLAGDHTLETQLPSVEVLSEVVRSERVSPKVTRTYSKKSSKEVALGVGGVTVSPSTPRQRKVILTVSEPVVSHCSVSPPVPTSPLPSGGDHSSDEDYLEERPLQIWVNATRSRRRLRLDRQRLDDGAVRERPICPADTVLTRVVNLSAYARGQAPRITWGVGARATNILFVGGTHGFRGLY